MTLITFQDGKVLFGDGKVRTEAGCCCDCSPCPHCASACLSVTISGFSAGGEPEECAPCDQINGTYVLTRGSGIAPTISASVSDATGTGAKLEASLAFQPESGTWTIDSVTVKNAGTCYSANAAFAYTITGAVVGCDDPPVVTLAVNREEPELDLSEIVDSVLPNGSGAVLTPVYVPVVTDDGQETWAIDSVTVTSGGINYETGQYVIVGLLGCTVEVAPASLKITVDATEPAQVSEFIESDDGAGASLSVTWALSDYAPHGVPHWQPVISASGGTGYQLLDNVIVEFPEGTFSGLYSDQSGEKIAGSVSEVGDDGEILAVDVLGVAAYFSSIGEIQSVDVLDGGEYYTPGGIESATVVRGGTFWPTESCEYSVCVPTECTVDGIELCGKITASVTADSVTVKASIDGKTVLTATASENKSPCDGVTFSLGEISSECSVLGEVTLAPAQCEEAPSEQPCCNDCEPCSAGRGLPHYGTGGRITGTWSLFGSPPIQFDWLFPTVFGWENATRPGNWGADPGVAWSSTLWRWDGSTETGLNFDEFGDPQETEVPALRHCGVGYPGQAWNAYTGEFLPREAYSTLLANPPPSDNKWYIFVFLTALYPPPFPAYHWGWVSACDYCGPMSFSSGGSMPEVLQLDTWTLCNTGVPCCTGNNAYPTFATVSECTGHSNVDWEELPYSPPCLGACCYNDGVEDRCGGSWSKEDCDGIGGTWHSGKHCTADDPCNLFP